MLAIYQVPYEYSNHGKSQSTVVLPSLYTVKTVKYELFLLHQIFKNDFHWCELMHSDQFRLINHILNIWNVCI